MIERFDGTIYDLFQIIDVDGNQELSLKEFEDYLRTNGIIDEGLISDIKSIFFKYNDVIDYQQFNQIFEFELQRKLRSDIISQTAIPLELEIGKILYEQQQNLDFLKNFSEDVFDSIDRKKKGFVELNDLLYFFTDKVKIDISPIHIKSFYACIHKNQHGTVDKI